MNNLKKILQQVLDYYNEVGCSRLLEILCFALLLYLLSDLKFCNVKFKNSPRQLNYGAR